ncbi:type I-E CRISPR-associated protein Cas6/Cse3/CasE [Micrococcus luteus]|nr:type I-E CRISPR-associated protein Cas6/Cse3/CasE [Micrococcus luteus]MCV7749136.1 type I-E CRISPR-associated protein Cas6/Cse3/CasE [Micrococcus luteus]
MSVLSRMSINGATRGGRRLLGDRQAMHAAVMAGFSPEAHDDMDGRVLWRVDHDGHRHTLYVTSPVEPDLTHLVEQAGWAGQAWQSADYGPFLGRLTRGQHWAFRLAANPVKAKAQPDGRRSRLLPHVTPEQQMAWLEARAPGWGFTVPRAGEGDQAALSVTRRQDERFGRGRGGAGKSRHRVTLRVVQFDGVLVVDDPDLLRQSLLDGMGRAKGYGCGLMTLRPAGS